jgi:hypothetical protein
MEKPLPGCSDLQAQNEKTKWTPNPRILRRAEPLFHSNIWGKRDRVD